MHEKPRIAALIVAAGIGARAGGSVPKQYQKLGGKALLRHAVEALVRHPAIDSVQVVIHPDHADDYAQAMQGLVVLDPVHGGAERSLSVRAGLAALAPQKPDYVLIHDAARPFLSRHVLDRLVSALEPEKGILPALAIADTVRRQQDNSWEEVPRDGLLRMQTPQAFPYAALYALHQQTDALFTDDAALWLAANKPLAYVEGEERLRKVTTEADILWAQQTLPQRIATGSGYDVHRLVPGDGVIIGGVTIAHDKKLDGHSDADVALHAITDALLGTVGAGDIGAHFPPSDAQWKGASSDLFVREAARLVKEKGGVIQHVDVTIICEMPKIGPHREAMREKISAMLDVPLAYVSVKATTTEKLGFNGRSEGISAQATATVRLPEEFLCSN